MMYKQDANNVYCLTMVDIGYLRLPLISLQSSESTLNE